MQRAFFIASLLVISLSSAATCFGQHSSGVYASSYRGAGAGHFNSGNRGFYGANRGRVAVVAVPFYGGAGYFGDYDSGYGPGPGPSDYSNAAAPPAVPAPPVIINQYFGGQPGGPPDQDPGGVRYYQQPAAAASAPPAEPRSYLLAFKDHSVYTALAYWFEGNTLNYVTPENTHNQADLSLVDVALTVRLNEDRTVPFSLPPGLATP